MCLPDDFYAGDENGEEEINLYNIYEDRVNRTCEEGGYNDHEAMACLSASNIGRYQQYGPFCVTGIWGMEDKVPTCTCCAGDFLQMDGVCCGFWQRQVDGRECSECAEDIGGALGCDGPTKWNVTGCYHYYVFDTENGGCVARHDAEGNHCMEGYTLVGGHKCVADKVWHMNTCEADKLPRDAALDDYYCELIEENCFRDKDGNMKLCANPKVEFGAHCMTCEESTGCGCCAESYTLTNNTATGKNHCCPYRSYYDIDDGYCKKCPFSCTACNTPDVCFGCIPNFHLVMKTGEP